MHIAGTGHFSITDLALTSPMMTRILDGFSTEKSAQEGLREINEIVLLFFNSYLKG